MLGAPQEKYRQWLDPGQVGCWGEALDTWRATEAGTGGVAVGTVQDGVVLAHPRWGATLEPQWGAALGGWWSVGPAVTALGAVLEDVPGDAGLPDGEGSWAQGRDGPGQAGWPGAALPGARDVWLAREETQPPGPGAFLAALGSGGLLHDGLAPARLVDGQAYRGRETCLQPYAWVGQAGELKKVFALGERQSDLRLSWRAAPAVDAWVGSLWCFPVGRAPQDVTVKIRAVHRDVVLPAACAGRLEQVGGWTLTDHRRERSVVVDLDELVWLVFATVQGAEEWVLCCYTCAAVAAGDIWYQRMSLNLVGR